MEIDRINQKRLTIRTQYDEKAVEFFRTLPKYHYDHDKKEWSFPVETLEQIKDYLELNDGVYMIIDSRKSTEIKVSSDKIRIHFAYHLANFDRIKALKSFSYDKETRMMECDSNELQKVKQYMSDEDMIFHVSNEEADTDDELLANSAQEVSQQSGLEKIAAFPAPLMLDDKVVKEYNEEAQC
jgi:hypothetical protein